MLLLSLPPLLKNFLNEPLHVYTIIYVAVFSSGTQAKLVASATGNLCEAANSVVQGQAQEEKLIAAAKAVASSTAQLLIACQVKADTRSENNRRLQVMKHCTQSTCMYMYYIMVHLCTQWKC